MTTDLYQDFAERYDLLAADEPSEPGCAAFFSSLFATSGVQRVLDCACGTGRDLVLFHELGLEVVGSDLSASMLEQARKRLESRGLDLRLEKADYRELPQRLRAELDAVVCLRSSIAHMSTDDEVLQAFKSMFGVLRSRGILVLSQGTTDAQWREQPRFIPVLNTQEVSRIVAVDYLPDRDATYHVLDLFHGQERQDFKVWDAKYHFVFEAEQAMLLKEAGFTNVEFYGGYGYEPYDRHTSRRLITVAHR